MDEVASAVTFEGGVYIFMRSGKVYRMYRDSITGQLLFQVMADLVPR